MDSSLFSTFFSIKILLGFDSYFLSTETPLLSFFSDFGSVLSAFSLSGFSEIFSYNFKSFFSAFTFSDFSIFSNF
jgi:hypothetical protein